MPAIKRKQESGDAESTPSKRQHIEDEITLLAGNERVEFKIPLTSLVLASPYLRAKFTGEWQDANDHEVDMSDTDPEIVSIVIEILKWKQPEILSGCQAGKLVICADRYDMPPVMEHIETFLKYRFDDCKHLKNGDDYLGILLAALHSREEANLSYATGRLLCMLPMEAFSRFPFDGESSLLQWKDTGKEDALRFAWMFLSQRARTILKCILSSAIDWLWQFNLNNVLAAERLLEKILSGNIQLITINYVVNELHTAVTKGEFGVISGVMQEELAVGKAGFCVDGVDGELHARNTDQDFVCSITTAKPSKPMPIGPYLEANHIEKAIKACDKLRDFDPEDQDDIEAVTNALSHSASQLRNALNVYNRQRDQLGLVNQARRATRELQDKLDRWLSTFTPYDSKDPAS